MLGGKASDTQPKDRALKEEMCTGSKQPGGESQKARQAAEHRTKAGTTAKAASEPPPEIAADAFTAALAAVPAEDWGRTWAADRTIMLRMTSKRVKELVDKMRPPAFVRFSRGRVSGRTSCPGPIMAMAKFLKDSQTPAMAQLLKG